MHITVIGCGYVGLVTGACLAKLGHKVTCVDTDIAKISLLNQGKCPIYEPELEGLLDLVTFTDELVLGDVVFIAVGTPANPDGSCNVDHVLEAAREVGETGKPVILVTKSTVPVGTGAKIQALAPACSIVSNPEFLREGQAIADFMNPDRIVIGTDSAAADYMMRRIYAPIPAPILSTDIASAELIKYAANGFLAMKIAYINELSWLAEESGADIEDVAKGMGMDKRIGPDYLKVGPGFGGSCFPKDLLSLRSMMSPTGLAAKTIESNYTHQLKLTEKINAICGAGQTLGVLGTAFKANTDDIRESPASKILPLLEAEIKTYDPKAPCTHTLEEVLECDIILIMTEWDEFKNLTFTKPVIDLRNLYEPMPNYHSLGRTYKTSQ